MCWCSCPGRARSAACRRCCGADARRGGAGAAALRRSAAASSRTRRSPLPPPGTRKVVLATNIAETSLTIPGVRVVVDSGLVRRARFDPVTGMSRLETQRISRASAEQRQGRAGRTAPGVCYRAWSEGAHAALAPFTPAEILEADLAPLALELASWGARDAAALRWLDAPPAALLGERRATCCERLGALDADGRISAHGRDMARLARAPAPGAHAAARPRARRSCRSARSSPALLSERDLLRGGAGARDADIRTRLELLRGRGAGAAVERGALQRARRVARDLERQLQRAARAAAAAAAPPPAPGLLLAFAYPDRIGRRRARGEGRLHAHQRPRRAFRRARRRSRARSSSSRWTWMTPSATRASSSPRRWRARTCIEHFAARAGARRRAWRGTRASRR